MSFFSGITNYFSSDPAAKLTAAKEKVVQLEADLSAARAEVSKLESAAIPPAGVSGSDSVTGGRRRKSKKTRRTKRSRNGRKSSRL